MNYFKMIKNWWAISQPKKSVFIAQIVTSCIANGLHVLATIPAAKVITCLTESNFNSAYIWLAIGFGLLLSRNIIWEFNYRLFPVQIRWVYMNAQRKILKKVFAANDGSFKLTSKERIINTIASNIYNCGEFCDFVATKTAYLFRAVVTLVVVLTTNLLVGLIIVFITILVYVILKLIYRGLGKSAQEIASNKDAIFEGFSDIVDSRIVSNDLDINELLKKDYESRSEALMENYKHKTHLNSLKDNWVFVLWNFIVMAASIYLVFTMSTGSSTMTLTLFLIVTPYLTSTIEYFVSFFNVFSDLENANVSACRVSNIYSMTENEMIDYGNNATDIIDAKVQFRKVDYDPSNKPEGCSAIKDVSFTIGEGQIAAITGQRASGKRTLFYLMRRAIKPDSGSISIGDINIYDFSRKSYVHNMGYVTSKPYYFNSSVMSNLEYVEKSKRKIEQVCKDLNIYDSILNLPNGFDTNMTGEASAFSDYLNFMIGLARVILTKCEIIMVYEFPRLSAEEQKVVKQTLVGLKKNRCIIIFSAGNICDDICDKQFAIDKGQISVVK